MFNVQVAKLNLVFHLRTRACSWTVSFRLIASSQTSAVILLPIKPTNWINFSILATPLTIIVDDAGTATLALHDITSTESRTLIRVGPSSARADVVHWQPAAPAVAPVRRVIPATCYLTSLMQLQARTAANASGRNFGAASAARIVVVSAVFSANGTKDCIAKATLICISGIRDLHFIVVVVVVVIIVDFAAAVSAWTCPLAQRSSSATFCPAFVRVVSSVFSAHWVEAGVAF